ncbi:hypothetical protein Taro_043861, partial [Colocasia esculenta]|nr:hypothetical protein [Colocasia esculenta]
MNLGHRSGGIFSFKESEDALVTWLAAGGQFWRGRAAVMADRRDWGGGEDGPEKLTQRIIERIWESLTEIRMMMDQKAPVPPVTGEAIHVAPVPPPPGVELQEVSWRLVERETMTNRPRKRRSE